MKVIKILAIDDQKPILDELQDLLSSEGYEVFLASEGEEGFQKAKSIIPDLIISDIDMPVMNGYLLLKKLKADPVTSSIPLIFLTAKSKMDDLRYGMNLGADDYIPKPFRMDDLKNAVQIRLKKQNLFLRQIENISKELQEFHFDLDIAEEIQQKLLPEKEKINNRVKYVYEFLPLNRVGGDILSITDLNDSILRFFLADATGHGIHASLITMCIKAEYKEITYKHSSPGTLLGELNNRFCQKYQELSTFFPCIVVDVHTKTGEMKYASGAFSSVLKNGSELVYLRNTGTLVGLKEDFPFETKTYQLHAGDKILLYTDGVTETMNTKDELFGEEIIFTNLKKADNTSELIKTIMEEMKSFRGKQDVLDDITIIGIDFE
ncbi:MAG: fused response regulator/phosphatase [Leptospiraceae bacterium]|nr:fused response regulator/phosphatase [Leptospiraceae bacterium]MCP5497477.1 fused response regulator/phosphatase [Leptospiraceae bacterium]